MDENEVIEALCTHLATLGYNITQRLHTSQQGVDVQARHSASGRMLHLEAKGGTSSREGSARFGKDFTPTQVYDRVAKAIYAALCLRAKYPDRTTDEVALACPDSPQYRKRVELVAPQLLSAGLDIYLVGSDRGVTKLGAHNDA